MPSVSHPLASVLRLLLCLAGYVAALCVANRPRFWWQELFASLALYWLPLAAIAFAWLARFVFSQPLKVTRGAASWGVLGALGCYGYVIVFMGCKLAPYLFYDRWPAQVSQGSATVSGLWIDQWGRGDSISALQALVTRKAPMVLMVSGENSAVELLGAMTERFPNQVRTQCTDGDVISVFSQLPFGAQQFDNLGVEAFPGGVFSLQVHDGRQIELGVMALSRSTSQELFERNRITARRLSSLMRNSREPRIVAAQFSTTPFSQLMALYPEQARLRSLMFGAGLHKTFNMEHPFVITTDSNIFVSRDFARLSFEAITIPERERTALFFRVALGPP
jgi:hypothetical protein